MSNEYSDPYKNEYPTDIKPSWGGDSTGGGGDGGDGGGGGGAGGAGGGGGGGIGGGSGSWWNWWWNWGDFSLPDDYYWGNDGTDENVWVAWLIFVYDYKFYDILTLNNDILTQDGDIQKGISGTIGFLVAVTLGNAEKTKHADCLIPQFDVNGISYNATRIEEASKEFFETGLMNHKIVSSLALQVKFQSGHYPPDINQMKLRFLNLKGEKILETGWIMLGKDYSTARNITFTQGKMNF